MAFNGSTYCVSYLKELMLATHNHAVGGNVFKMALYTDAATLDETTTVYSDVDEIVGTSYVAGGITLVNIDPVASATKAYTQFENPVILNATVTARGGLIYNSTNGNKAVAVIDFGSDKTVVGADFTITMPLFTDTTALLRIAAA